MTTAPKTDASVSTAPIIVDLGKHPRKQVKQLRKGTGKLMDEVMHSIEELKTAGRVSEQVLPVIVVVREKRKAQNWIWPKL